MSIAATLMRGGTSKCWLFDQSEAPEDRPGLTALLIELFGSDDPRQLDGVGGGTPVTSKAAVVSRSPEIGVDVDYLFAQVGIGSHLVEWGSNCGNCATAVALWAAEKYQLPATADGIRVVRMRNLNTGAILVAEVGAVDAPEVSVPGVRGGGHPVGLTFLNPAGATTGSLWPSGSTVDTLPLGQDSIEVSLVDAGAPVTLALAADIQLNPAPSEPDIVASVPRLRALRQQAAVRMGLVRSVEDAQDAVPKVGVVGPSVAYRTSLGDEVPAEEYDVSVRMLSMNAPHPTIGLTSAVALMMASVEGGTILERVGVRRGTRTLRIGTLSGVLHCSVETKDGQPQVSLQRAARFLAQATLFTHPTPSIDRPRKFAL